MPYLRWNEELTAGIGPVDEQHKELLTILELLSQAIADKEKKAVIIDLFRQLYNHSREHFLSEEHLMDQYGYPGLATHKEHHTILMDRLRNLQDEAIDGSLPPAEEAVGELRDWFTAHILRDDLEFAPFIREKQRLP